MSCRCSALAGPTDNIIVHLNVQDVILNKFVGGSKTVMLQINTPLDVVRFFLDHPIEDCQVSRVFSPNEKDNPIQHATILDQIPLDCVSLILNPMFRAGSLHALR